MFSLVLYKEQNLFSKSKHEDVEKCKTLIKQISDLNFKELGCTPLHYAADAGSLECTRLLIEANVHPLIKTEDFSENFFKTWGVCILPLIPSEL
eukprot:TRINITY_DN689_c0_g1_i1.p1 TRINITY_DN689_c0_g1~~TRINITY_DN689_c0_g1_i1.p1  ORF type:complete len:94 (-),score=11.37 TRINITY_DN689_c0_g1_i1:192-473(-)